MYALVFCGQIRMPEAPNPAASSTADGPRLLSTLTGLFEGGGGMLQSVFASNSAEEKVDGGSGGGGSRKGEEAGAGAGSSERPQSLGRQQPRGEGAPAAAAVLAHPTKTTANLRGPAAKANSYTTMPSATSAEGDLPDLPELGRLERTKTPNMLEGDWEEECSSNNNSSPPSCEVGWFIQFLVVPRR